MVKVVSEESGQLIGHLGLEGSGRGKRVHGAEGGEEQWSLESF